MSRPFTYLTDIPIFAALSEEDAEFLRQHAYRKKFAARSVIQMEGWPADLFFIITDGLCRTVLFCEDGREILLQYCRPGDFFGETNLLEHENWPYSILSVERSEFIVMPLDVIRQLLRRNGDFALGFLALMSRRLVNVQNRLRHAISDRAEQKILRFFEQLASQIGIQAGSGLRIPARISHQQIADTCGLRRETVTRLMKQLQKGGRLYKTSEGWILLPK